MYELIFRNWKFAMLWAIGLTASAAAFTESDGGQAEIQASADQIRAQREQLAPAATPAAAPLPPSSDPAMEDGEEASPAETEAPVEPGEATDSAV